MNDLMVNGSGIKDPTAYKAIKNFEGGGKTMNQITPGSIWSSNDKEYLIIAFNEIFNYATVLRLMQGEFGSALKIRSRDIRYADPMRLQYVFEENLQDFIRQLSDEEFEQTKMAIADALGLNIAYGQQDETCTKDSDDKKPESECDTLRQISMQEAVEKSANEYECVYIAKKLEPDEAISELISAEIFLLKKQEG